MLLGSVVLVGAVVAVGFVTPVAVAVGRESSVAVADGSAVGVVAGRGLALACGDGVALGARLPFASRGGAGVATVAVTTGVRVGDGVAGVQAASARKPRSSQR